MRKVDEVDNQGNAEENIQQDQKVESSDKGQDNEILGNPGIKALRVERQRVKELEAQLREFENQGNKNKSSDNADSDVVTLKEQLGFLTSGNAELQTKIRLQQEQYKAKLEEKEKQIENYEIKNSFEKISLAAGLDPRYLGLYYSSVRPELKVVEGKVVHRTGVELNEWIETNKLNYPDLFKANNPGGVGARGGGATTNSKGRVSRSDPSAYFKNLGRIAKGEIQVDD